MEKKFKVVAIAGSLRQQSLHQMLVRAAQELAPDNMEIEVLDISQIPLYNSDVESAGWPPAVAEFRDKIEAAHGVIFAVPEYNGSVPGVLKNAFDWASRRGLVAEKPGVTMGGSPGALGATKAQEHMRQVMMHTNMYVMPRPTIAIPKMGDKFVDGKLVDEPTRGFLAEQLQKFANWIGHFN
ncbi:MAG: NAD(P)H-dependent oxidoreductase [Anaerolineales bacterium]|nr:NAD(P)H-dependent oxidoreductase [Anaerolineales bacterium]MCB0009172.1 NAD(P)H-dependent oxidoreductase [Anaerolineales bacterium]MCB0020336.1 NAD(P)H-dependent oxidoreductase [Anaerolineales bacterium]MCB0031807.1 NAD(P)H-dependent oxidoreductase [Anaerolineales bacterium]MCB8962191.1 NAD(P)H-dependent oxidoreductase [Ardenticatenales bacterium]